VRTDAYAQHLTPELSGCRPSRPQRIKPHLKSFSSPLATLNLCCFRLLCRATPCWGTHLLRRPGAGRDVVRDHTRRGSRPRNACANLSRRRRRARGDLHTSDARAAVARYRHWRECSRRGGCARARCVPFESSSLEPNDRRDSLRRREYDLLLPFPARPDDPCRAVMAWRSSVGPSRGASAIPVDQVIINEPYDRRVLMLPLGRFWLRTIDRDGKVIAEAHLRVR
jgi:hypothetical protein